MTLDYLLQKQNDWKYFARSKLIGQHERQKLVQAGALLVLLFLIGKLQDFTSSCSKSFEKLLFLKCYTVFFHPKTKILDTFSKDSSFSAIWKTEIGLCRVSLVLLFSIRELQDLTSSCSKKKKKKKKLKNWFHKFLHLLN